MHTRCKGSRGCNMQYRLMLALCLCSTLPSLLQAAFLQDRLPLKPLVTTPLFLLKGDERIVLTDYQALTVVFSRPVIALGSDFGAADNFGGSVPFNISCKDAPVPSGKFRWVTTTIARFDPDAIWPTDLDCTFTFNQLMTSYDGVPVLLPETSTRQLTSEPLLMSLGSVESKKAEDLTAGEWTARMQPSYGTPEVPPDGIVRLDFNFPVNLALIKSALKLSPNSGNRIKLNVSRCFTPAPWINPRLQSASDSDNLGDDACVAVSFLKPLSNRKGYDLVLPKGTKYSSKTGRTLSESKVRISGLRAFKLYIKDGFQMIQKPDEFIYDGAKYRRLRFWLPHGLEKPSQPEKLISAISLCRFTQPFDKNSPCTPVPITSGKLAAPAYLEISVASLQPRNKYKISVAARPDLKDGFGLPLESSEGVFWTQGTDDVFQGPNAGPIAVFDPADGFPETWPYILRGDGGDRSPKTLSYWSLRASSTQDASNIISVLVNSQILTTDVLGRPRATYKRGDSKAASVLNVPLDNAANVHVFSTCCDMPNYPKGPEVSSNLQVILKTGYTVTWSLAMTAKQQVVAWANGPNGKPASGVTALIYTYDFVSGQVTTPKLLSQCRTGADGSCTIALPPSDNNLNMYGVAMAKGVVVGVASVGSSSVNAVSPYRGSLVLDRALVRPGDALHVTGYIVQKNEAGKGLSVAAPNITAATLQISPSLKGEDTPTILSVKVDPEFGSVHATIPVPAGASAGDYYVTLLSSSTASPTASAAPQVSSRFSTAPSSPSDDLSLATESFKVSDPRPPTAELRISAPTFARPNAKVTVGLTAVSYLGSSVAFATINLKWSTSKAEAVIDATTDASGNAQAVIDLSSLPAANRSNERDTLFLEASWIGPTRERITASASVTLDVTSRRVSVARDLPTIVPGETFMVTATVTNNADGKEQSKVPITVTLKPNTTNNVCKDISIRTTVSGNAGSVGLALPCVGVFELSACTADRGELACDKMYIGLNATEWSENPLDAWTEPSVTASGQYKVGDTAVLRVNSPYAKASALVLWGNIDQDLKKQFFKTVPQGVSELKFMIGEECRGGCNVEALLFVRRSKVATFEASKSENLPVSKLFQPTAPHSHVYSLPLSVTEDRSLSVAVSVAGATASQPVVVSPGGDAAISVSVTRSGKPVGNAEVTVVGVDKGVLDLLPYSLKSVVFELTYDLSAAIQSMKQDNKVVLSAGLKASIDTLIRRLGLDPWLPVDTTCKPPESTPYYEYRPFFPGGGYGYSNAAAVDQSDERYLAMFNYLLTQGPENLRPMRGPFPVYAQASATNGGKSGTLNKEAMNVGSVADANVGSSDGGAVAARLASAFVGTPLFTFIKTQSNGKGVATFTAPQNLGTFVIRAYAAAPAAESAFGSAETSLIVRRRISLEAALPRITRVGDVFQAGVLITVPELGPVAPEFAVTLVVNLAIGSGSALTLLSKSNGAVVRLPGPDNQAEVKFSFKADRIGSADLTFSVTDNEGGDDALTVTVPVLPQQSPVFVATSFAINATASGYQEGLALPDVIPGSGAINVAVGVGYLPAILSATGSIRAIAGQVPTTQVLNAETALVLATTPALLALYKQSIPSSVGKPATRAVKDLVKLTRDDRGLLPYDPTLYGGSAPDRTDIVLNAQAYWAVKRFPRAKAGTSLATLQSKLAPTWIRAAASQIILDAVTARDDMSRGVRQEPYNDWYTLAWLRLALGADVDVPACGSPEARALGACTADAQIRADLSIGALVSGVPKSDAPLATLVAVALQASSIRAKYSAFITSAADTLMGGVRITGRTAYFASSPGARSPADIITQALGLRLLVALKRSGESAVVQKVAAYVAASCGSAGSGPVAFGSILPPISPSGMAVLVASSSLAAYDVAVGSLKPNLTVSAAIGSTTLLRTTKFDSTTVSKPPVTASTTWDKLPRTSKPRTINFKVTGKGEASVSLGLSFVPAKLLTFPTYRGIWVNSVIQATDALTGQATGPALSTVPIGTLVTVTVQITSPDELGPVTITALMPGGLEPLDPALTNAAGLDGASCPLLFYAGDVWDMVFRPVYPLCPVQQVTPRSVIWKYGNLMAGTQTFVYRAIAATEGVFKLPPITASADNQPEVMGMTAAGDFTICAGKGCKAVALPATAAVAKACPKDCSGNGACDIGKGVCVCQGGWKGAACDVNSA